MSSFSSIGQKKYHSNAVFGGSLPQLAGNSNEIVFREAYVLSANPKTKLADWVLYRLDEEYINGPERNRNWKVDPKLPDSLTLEPSPDDYKGAYAAYKFDRGHMAPLGSFDGYEMWHEVNYYSNIAPQMAALNRGVWKKLESVERELVDDCLNLYVMCGTIYEDSMPSLPNADEPHVVPSHFWKILVCETDLDTNVASFIFPQGAAQSSPLYDYSVTLKEIENRSGYSLFGAQPKIWKASFDHFIMDEWIVKKTR